MKQVKCKFMHCPSAEFMYAHFHKLGHANLHMPERLCAYKNILYKLLEKKSNKTGLNLVNIYLQNKVVTFVNTVKSLTYYTQYTHHSV